ncbi:MAG: tetratricopeptide repeat protein [Candidatus Omnitrophica bacterium]|nr:tetratricopeptide repeat protein [Candidatus Omnitrophota bacterium]
MKRLTPEHRSLTLRSLAGFVLFGFLYAMVQMPSTYALFDEQSKEKIAELESKIKQLEHEKSKVAMELENVNLDRKNLVKQASTFQREKEELLQKLQEMKGVSSGADVELESLKRENEILAAELEKLRAAREKDRDLFNEEKTAVERRVQEQEARANSLAKSLEEYTPERIEEIVADRNRLQEENQRMAQKVFEYEQRLEELRKQMTPLELDREELHRIQTESRELKKKIQYLDKLESRQEQLIKENKEYREQVEVLKSKLKDAVPGLAKASRVSQKMMRENADMHYNLGTIFLHNKRYRESIKEYERVLELRPNDPETHYNLGVLYDDYLKDREKALYHYQKYLAINPKAPDAKKVESYILSLELEHKVR